MNALLRRLVPSLAALALFAAAAHAAMDSRFDPSHLVIPPLHPIPKVTPQRSVLPNGMVIYLLEDHSLPRVQGVLYVKASSTWAPNSKAGLGGLMSEVMRSGGSATQTGDWMDDRLAAIGASVTSSLSADLATVGFSCLADNTGEVLGLVAEVTRRPAFPDDKIELSKVGLRRAIAGRNDEMFDVLSRVSRQAVYGKDSPYARTPEYATIESITRDDCIAFHKLCYAPERAYFVVYGDFKAADVKTQITKLFGDWKKSGVTPPAMPPMPAASKSRLVFAPKDDVTQSAVVLAQLGFKADDPDGADMDVLEQALGGGFQSRLFNRIRTQRGLAYAAGASVGSGFIRPGVFQAYSLTRNDSVFAALDLVRANVEEVTKAPLTEQEAKVAKESVENSLVFQFEKPSSTLFRAAFYELAGYPADFLQRYQASLAKVTPTTILAAAQRKIHPDQLLTIIVGKESEFDRKLESAGLPVERVDITIPPPPSKLNAGAATPEALAKGQDLLAKAAKMAGGAEAWAAIKSWQSEGSLSLSMQGQSLQFTQSLWWILPDKQLSVQKLPFGEMSMGFNGKTGWRKMATQIQDEPVAAKQTAEQYAQSLFHLFGNAGSLKVQALDPKTIDGVSYAVALVNTPDVQDWTLFFAPDGRLARMEFVSDGPKGPAHETQIYDDWKPVGNIQYPHKLAIMLDGEKYVDGTLTSATVNPTIDPAKFEKPAN
jgi:predicted Zn-dependent peptidase